MPIGSKMWHLLIINVKRPLYCIVTFQTGGWGCLDKFVGLHIAYSPDLTRDYGLWGDVKEKVKNPLETVTTSTLKITNDLVARAKFEFNKPQSKLESIYENFSLGSNPLIPPVDDIQTLVNGKAVNRIILKKFVDNLEKRELQQDNVTGEDLFHSFCNPQTEEEEPEKKSVFIKYFDQLRKFVRFPSGKTEEGAGAIIETENKVEETAVASKFSSVPSETKLPNPFRMSVIKKHDKIIKKVVFKNTDDYFWDTSNTILTGNMNTSGTGIFQQLKEVIRCIRNFNASSGKNTAQFISNVEHACRHIPVAHHREFIKRLREKLVGPRAQNIDLASFQDLKEFTDYLDRNFGHNKTAVSLMAELSHLAQLENESVFEYYDKLKDLEDEINIAQKRDSYGLMTTDRYYIEIFKRGLKPDMITRDKFEIDESLKIFDPSEDHLILTFNRILQQVKDKNIVQALSKDTRAEAMIVADTAAGPLMKHASHDERLINHKKLNYVEDKAEPKAASCNEIKDKILHYVILSQPQVLGSEVVGDADSDVEALLKSRDENIKIDELKFENTSLNFNKIESNFENDELKNDELNNDELNNDVDANDSNRELSELKESPCNEVCFARIFPIDNANNDELIEKEKNESHEQCNNEVIETLNAKSNNNIIDIAKLSQTNEEETFDLDEAVSPCKESTELILVGSHRNTLLYDYVALLRNLVLRNGRLDLLTDPSESNREDSGLGFLEAKLQYRSSPMSWSSIVHQHKLSLLSKLLIKQVKLTLRNSRYNSPSNAASQRTGPRRRLPTIPAHTYWLK
ncbi:hypothetical protein TKK_0000160 [Trichogramma kaykai]